MEKLEEFIIEFIRNDWMEIGESFDGTHKTFICKFVKDCAGCKIYHAISSFANSHECSHIRATTYNKLLDQKKYPWVFL